MIPVNEPVLSKEAKAYVNECLRTGWISSAGRFINLFEKGFADYLGVKHGVTTTNGTTALHLAIAAMGIGEGDEVIVPDLTIISCALAVIYTGATPVFVDVDPVTGNIDPARIEKRISRKTKAIMVVHVYGHPADMDPILTIARRHHIRVIEDAAEAHGALYKGRKVGSIGDVACFSFYANKIITTGEGGMVVTNSDALAAHARTLKDLAHAPKRRFWHKELGFNYRMTNMQAALGLGELAHIATYIRKKRQMAKEYTKLLADIPYLSAPHEEPWATSVYWMFALTVAKNSPFDRDGVRERLKKLGVDTRNFFIPLHRQPIIKKLGFGGGSYPTSDDLSRRGFYIPSGLALTNREIRIVSDALHRIFV
jgi:perosamine synthetase